MDNTSYGHVNTLPEMSTRGGCCRMRCMSVSCDGQRRCLFTMTPDFLYVSLDVQIFIIVPDNDIPQLQRT